MTDTPRTDPTEPTDHSGSGNFGPQLLPTIPPSSQLGQELRTALGRLRFAGVDPAIQRMAQEVMDGKAHPRDLLNMPELRPLQEKAAAEMRDYLGSLDEDERKRVLGQEGDIL